MLEFLAQNIGTIAVAVIVASVVAVIIIKQIKDKKRASPPAVATAGAVPTRQYVTKADEQLAPLN